MWKVEFLNADRRVIGEDSLEGPVEVSIRGRGIRFKNGDHFLISPGRSIGFTLISTYTPTKRENYLVEASGSLKPDSEMIFDKLHSGTVTYIRRISSEALRHWLPTMTAGFRVTRGNNQPMLLG